MKTLAVRLVLLLALLLHAPALLALGLGQVEVRSRAGEPLLAEIPIISSDPRELENLQARLASPETFRRIGLDPPAGLVSDLRFAIALDPQGRPVIRITTAAPVQQPVLNFLVEVEWGQGRLVREYSALVDAPDTVAAPAQPPIQAAEAAPSNLIERPAETAVAAADDPVPEAEAEVTEQAEAAADEVAAAEPEPASSPQPQPQPQPVPAPAAAPSPQAVAAGGEYGPVQSGQTLSEIASTLSAGSGHSLNQVMLALLRSNPEAFIGGNVNLIRQGAVLRVPPSSDWSDISVAEANAVVREHVARWREMRRPVPQPDAVATGEEAGRADSAPVSAGTAAGARAADARLEIVPAVAGGASGAGTQTGTAAGGEGDMLQQQELVQTRETLAARDAEVEELKTRLAELEQLQQQQAQLIQMKDSELAAAQQRLAGSNAETAAEADAGAAAGAGDGLPWLWIGLGLVAAALLVAWLVSRRKGAVPARRQGQGFASVASRPAASSAAADAVAQASASAPVARAEDAPVPAPNASTWTEPPAAATGASPTWHAGGEDSAAASAGAEVAPLNPAPAGQERIELARAYLDLGDTDTARSLLQEVADFGDADARDQARQLLRELA